MPHRPPNELLGYLRRYDPEIGDLTLSVREFVLTEMSPPHEYVLNVSYMVAMGCLFGWHNNEPVRGVS